MAKAAATLPGREKSSHNKQQGGNIPVAHSWFPSQLAQQTGRAVWKYPTDQRVLLHRTSRHTCSCVQIGSWCTMPSSPTGILTAARKRHQSGAAQQEHRPMQHQRTCTYHPGSSEFLARRRPQAQGCGYQLGEHTQGHLYRRWADRLA